ncbi:UNVERIFIED_CONTAM: hypothetical protein GTU68_020930 [Idotea baltica]|nr:hypothetical protein [Idotea baltica]
MKTLRIGTRGSRLALYQAHLTEQKLRELGYEVEIIVIKTQGDRVQDLSFDKLEGKGFFTKEIEDELLTGTIDMAVHSMKDLPTTSPDGLCITAIIDRADPADTLLIHPSEEDATQDFGLRQGAKVGTSSVRRKSQMQQLRPDLEVADLRGNVPTRVQKLRDGAYSAIILAHAGLNRLELDLSDLIVRKIHTSEMVPAPAQGAIAVQTRIDDIELRRLLKELHQPDVSQLTNIERGVLRAMDGGCQLPLGVHCRKDENGHFHVHVAYAHTMDKPLIRKKYSVSTSFGLVDKIINDIK